MKEGGAQIIARKERLLGLKIVAYLISDLFILLMCIPLTWKRQTFIFTELYSILDRINSEYVFIYGDFTIVYDKFRDVIAGLLHDSEEITSFNKWINYFNLKILGVLKT